MKGLFDHSPGGSQPSTSSTQFASTPPTSVLNPQPVPEVLGQPSAPPGATLSHLRLRDGDQNPLAAPIPPTPYGADQSAKHEGWAELKTFASLLGKGAAIFGPLKGALDDVLACIETFESVTKNREDYQRLRTDLNALLHDLPGYFGESTPPEMRSSIVDLAKGINRELDFIQKKQGEHGVRPYILANTNAEEVLACYRRIRGQFERFTLNADISTWKIVAEQTMEAHLKNLPNSPDAMYRSAKSSNLRGGCTPETRVQVLEQLRDWAYDGESEKIYWMNGMAGTGKTTIAYSLCERLERTQQLAASFFCSRQLPECRDVDRIVPTISYQLARFSRPFRYAVSAVLEKNPDVHNQLLPDQFTRLILEPLNRIKDTLPTDLIIVIDALDECDGDGGDEILDVLLSSVQELPVKFFVASRPEAKILDRMGNRDGRHTELRLHELAHSSVQEDIRGYLTTKFKSSPMSVSADKLGTLIERSGVLFIYAATVIRYIGRDNFARGAKRLEEVLSVSSGSSSGSDKGIDALYTAILKAAFDDPDLPESDRAEMKLILGTIIYAQEPLSLEVIADLLGLDGGESVQAALRPLRSVLHVSDTTHIVATLHESFPEYLGNEGRSNRFYCDTKEQNARLARLCFDRINTSSPPFNICNLESSYVFDKDVPDLVNRVKKAISEGLFYACRYWDAHLRLAEEAQDIADTLFDFLSNRLL
ncbi:hypothetical protein FRC08_001906 [Ceratobasidium sp. 394]|nr:hypothetical protein FRC08_001906 [Ceratobasidium sp. 394]